MHRPGSDRGEDGNRRDPGGPGRGTGNAGTAHRLPGKGDRSYVSKSLEGSEQRYCTARKELLAVVRALKHFKCYLYGQKITVRTDNSAVSWLHRSKDPVGQPHEMDRGH